MKTKIALLTVLAFHLIYSLADHCPVDTDFEMTNSQQGEKNPWYSLIFKGDWKVVPAGSTWRLREDLRTYWKIEAPVIVTYAHGYAEVNDVQTPPAQALLAVLVTDHGPVKCRYTVKTSIQGNSIIATSTKNDEIDTHSPQFAKRFYPIDSKPGETTYECYTTAPNAKECEW